MTEAPSSFDTESQKNTVSIIYVSDLDDNAAKQQELAIKTHIQPEEGKLVHHSNLNYVPPFNTVAAAQVINAFVSEGESFLGNKIFVITVDPHVNQNGEDGATNITDKRVALRYRDSESGKTVDLIGPARDYMSVPGHQGLVLEEVVELDREKLRRLDFTAKARNDVFDGLTVFGPAAAALTNGLALDQIGTPLPKENLPPLIIEPGTITEIEPEYQNIRLHVPISKFQSGDRIAIKTSEGRLLAIATRTEAFDREKGEIVAANGSKTLITDRNQVGLYLAQVQGHLAQFIKKNRNLELQPGDTLSVELANEADEQEWLIKESWRKAREHVVPGF